MVQSDENRLNRGDLATRINITSPQVPIDLFILILSPYLSAITAIVCA
jgi:hypothetical protein